jgi:hypothetical protein
VTRCTNPSCGEYGRAAKQKKCHICGAAMKKPEARTMRDPAFWNGNAPRGRYPDGKLEENRT